MLYTTVLKPLYKDEQAKIKSQYSYTVDCFNVSVLLSISAIKCLLYLLAFIFIHECLISVGNNERENIWKGEDDQVTHCLIQMFVV